MNPFARYPTRGIVRTVAALVFLAVTLAAVIAYLTLGFGPSPAPSARPSAPTAAPGTAGPSVAIAPSATAGPTPTQTPPVPAGFVYRQGSQLFLDGRPFTFTGLNVYNANSRTNVPGVPSCWYDLGSGHHLDESLTAIGPTVRVVRAWFLQDLATRSGQRDWSAFDRTLATARAHNVKVIAALSLQGGDCGTGRQTYKSETWYARLYRTQIEPGYAASYLDWVQEVLTRYRNDPTILAWEPVSEAEDQTNRASAGGVCTATAPATLRAFYRDVGARMKFIDPNHLIEAGLIGSGQCGTSGPAYQGLMSDPNLDICSYHDYGEPTAPLPGKENGLQVRARECKALGKPLIVGEMGIRPSEISPSTLEQRAADFEAKIQAQAGLVAGWMLWDWRDGPHGGSSTSGYEIGPGDPALALLK